MEQIHLVVDRDGFELRRSRAINERTRVNAAFTFNLILTEKPLPTAGTTLTVVQAKELAAALESIADKAAGQ